ncbi:hypothetical protein [Paenibacillus hamazuiensis]|uniref:hypothetical protein n=1 Tax=Paenibacillus hamazuiensis TaxID=2936508 RepID=UPI00200D1AA9|nr:hypothetical protein [Paenibacillus hamazuiensis]
MGAKKSAGKLASFVISGMMALAVVHDATSHATKNMSVPAIADTAFDGMSWTASPERLTDGSDAKIKPLLGTMSGAIALHYRGAKDTVAVSIEYWQNGMKTKTSEGLSMGFPDSEIDNQGNYQFDSDFVYSLQNRYDTSGATGSDLVYALVSKNGYGSTAVKVEKPAEINMLGEMKLQTSVKVPLNESTLVWGLQGTDAGQMTSYSSMADTLQHAKWAMVVRIGFPSP